VAGRTNSNDFPSTTDGAQASCSSCEDPYPYFDAFVARLSADLRTLRQATYLGGSALDEAYALAIHPITGEVYVAGWTNSDDFPGTTGGAQETYGGGEKEVFVARLSADLRTLHQSTYLGGSDWDMAYALAIHPITGEVYVAGWTKSDDFPRTTGGAQASYGGKIDAFVARLTINLTAGPILSISEKPTNGTITSNPAGINCGSGGSMCSADFADGTSVTLIATPDPGYVFVGWGGACATLCGNSNPCTITISSSSDITCTAIFMLSGSGGGPGSGSVSGRTCGSGGGCSMTGSASSMAGLWNILVWLSVPIFALVRRIRKK